jgi:ribonuclease BN (tRNA processing enzyme)
VRLTVLGSSAAFPGPGGAASGYLLQHDGFNLCLDLGTGTLASLQEHIGIEDVHGVVISHPHWDHFLDLYPMFVARHWHERELSIIDVVAPTGFEEFFLRLNNSEEGVATMRQVYTFAEVEPGDPFEIGPFSVQTQLLPHWVRNMGTRFSADRTTLTYTGDTGPADEIAPLARGSDVLIAEASWQVRPEGVDPFHLTAQEAGEEAERAGVGRLVLSHLWPGDDRDRSRELAAKSFGGDLVVADDGLGLEVGS